MIKKYNSLRVNIVEEFQKPIQLDFLNFVCSKFEIHLGKTLGSVLGSVSIYIVKRLLIVQEYVRNDMMRTSHELVTKIN